MTSRVLIWLVALGVALAACTSGSSETTVASTVPTTAVAPTTTTSSSTTTMVPATTTTTTLSPTVALPAEAEAFGYRIEFDATVSEPGTTDILFSSIVEGALVGDADAFEQREWFGSQIVRDAEYVLVGNQGWVKEDRKPWRELPSLDVLSIQSSTVYPTDFAGVYDVVNTLDWDVRDFNGRQARVYNLPSDRAGELSTWLPAIVAQDLDGVETYDLEVWIDAESEYVVRMALSAVGPESMLADGAITEDGRGDLTLEMLYEFLDVNGERLLVPSIPDLTTPDAPDGFYVYEEAAFGFRLNAPLDWTLFPGESFDGYEIPFSAAPSIDVPNDSYFSIAIEDLSSSQGLRVDEYAELNLRFITPFEAEVTEVLTSESIEFAGLPGWLTVADIESPEERFRVRTVTLIDGSLGYSLEFYSWDNWYLVDLDTALEMFNSFEFYDPSNGST